MIHWLPQLSNSFMLFTLSDLVVFFPAFEFSNLCKYLLCIKIRNLEIHWTDRAVINNFLVVFHEFTFSFSFVWVKSLIPKKAISKMFHISWLCVLAWVVLRDNEWNNLKYVVSCLQHLQISGTFLEDLSWYHDFEFIRPSVATQISFSMLSTLVSCKRDCALAYSDIRVKFPFNKAGKR